MSTTSTRIPAVLTGHALLSLRDSGYTLPAAISEVIDNSLEAEANEINVYLQEEPDGRGKSRIGRIAIADDGIGMGLDDSGADILQRYLQVGYSTRYMSTTTIGKYGVGAKLAALNFAQRIDVWGRTDGEEPWRHAFFDLEEALDEEARGGAVELQEPDEVPIDEELEFLMPEGSGVVVVWSKIDRLDAGRWATDANVLRLDLEKELSRVFREFLSGGIAINVNETALMAHDPSFRLEGTWADRVLTEEKARAETGSAGGRRRKEVLGHFPAEVIAEETFKVDGHPVTLAVTLMPKEVTRGRGQGGDALAKKLRVPENQGALSFMRMNREISYTNVPKIFPRGIEDPDRFIGIEVRFRPDLDEYFGVRNVKRGVEPHGELREKIRNLLQRYVPQARKKLDERWGEVARQEREHTGEHTPIANAAGEANQILPKSPSHDSPTAQSTLDDLIKDVIGDTGAEDEREEFRKRMDEQPFVVESVDFPGQMFIDVQHVGSKVIIRVNTRHRFYRELWGPIRMLAEQDPGSISGEQAVKSARRTVEALTLLVIAYGKAEAMDRDPGKYNDLRGYWGQFLDTLMGKVKDVL